METKIFQEDQDKLVTPFFPVSSLYVLVSSSNFLRCGLPTNHEDHYKQASSFSCFLLFCLAKNGELCFCFAWRENFNTLQRLFSPSEIYIHFCVWSDLPAPCYALCVWKHVHTEQRIAVGRLRVGCSAAGAVLALSLGCSTTIFLLSFYWTSWKLCWNHDRAIPKIAGRWILQTLVGCKPHVHQKYHPNLTWDQLTSLRIPEVLAHLHSFILRTEFHSCSFSHVHLDHILQLCQMALSEGELL